MKGPNSVELEEINIYWEGAFTYYDIINDEINPDEYYNKATDIGLYQVYGYHPLYGAGVLLYIGMTTKQSFKTRLKNRMIISNSSDCNRVEIYLGRIFSTDEKISIQQEKDYIFKAEALLINTLKPAFNSSYINSVHHKKVTNGKDFVVFNQNSYRSLLPELSTLRWWNSKELNYELVEKISKKLNIKISDNDDFYGFALKTNESICLGVDHAYWDKEKIPLVIGIYKESIDKSKLEEIFIDLGEDKEYYFIPACENLKSEGVDEIMNNLVKVEGLLESE